MIPYIMDDTKTLTALAADTSNGIGRLPEAVYCFADESRNGQFTVSMKVPSSARHFDKLHTGGILKLKANDDMDSQLFRIDSMSRTMADGCVILNLNHITYDMLKMVCLPFSAQGITNVLQGIINHTVSADHNPFSFVTDIPNTESMFNLAVPRSWREVFGGVEGSILDTFGGQNNYCEIKWDNLQVHFLEHRGTNRNVVIEYGKNLTSAKQEESIADVYTACLGYATSEEFGTVIGDVYHVAQVTYPKVLIMDFSNEFEYDEQPTVAKLNQLAEQYAVNNRIFEPKVNLAVSFDLLRDVGEEELLRKLTDVRLCDRVQVRFLEMGIDVIAEIIKVRYDVLNECYTSMTLGSYMETFTDRINGIESTIYNNIKNIKSFTLQQINALSRALQEEIDGKITTYYQSSAPADADEGDLWIDTDDNSLHRYNGTSWIDVQDSDIQTALTLAGDAQSTADRKIVTYAQASAPSTNLDVGDLWLDTDDNNILYRWNGESWVNVRDAGITAAQTLAQNALNTAQSKITTYYQSSAPTGVTTGDLWIDTDDGNSLHRWNGSTWQNVQDAELAQALQAAGDAQATADGKVITFAQTSQPTASAVGDLWIDTDDGNKLYRWNGTTWVNVQDAAIASANTLAQNALNSANAKTTTYYQNSAPSSAVSGDLWINTAEGNALYRYNGSSWVNVQDADLAQALQDAADAQATADSKIVTFAQSTTPTGADTGDLWVDTGNGNLLKRFNGTTWVEYQDADIATAQQTADDAAAAVVTLNNTLNSTEIFNRLTDNGNIQGIYKYQGNIYLNGEYLNANGATIGGFAVDTNSIHTKNTASDATSNNAIWLSSSTFSRAIGGTSRSNLKFAIGGSFAVDQAGTLYASNAILDGRLNTGGSNGTYANLYSGVLRGGGKDRNSDNIVEYGYISFPGGQVDAKGNTHNTVFLTGKDAIVLKGHVFTYPQYDVAGNRHALNGVVELPWNGASFKYDVNDKLEPNAGNTKKGSNGLFLYFTNGMLVLVDPKGSQDGTYWGDSPRSTLLDPNSAV